MNRRNAAKQVQSKKRHALVSATRLFSGVDGAPRIVAVIPLSEDVDARSAASTLAESLDANTADCPEHGLWKLKYSFPSFNLAYRADCCRRAERFKTSLQFINVPYRHLYAALDACKSADYVLFVLSSTVEVDPWGDLLLRTLQAQGLPEVVSCVAPTTHPTTDAKARSAVLKSLLSFMHYFVPTQTRVFDLDTPADRINAVRALCEGRPADVRWREGRAWVLAEDVSWVDGVMGVTGVVRGAQLSANRLVHLPGYGDFQINKVSFNPPTYALSIVSDYVRVDHVRASPTTRKRERDIHGH